MAFKDIYLADIGFAFKDIGDPVSYNGYNTYGILVHEPTEVLSMNEKTYAVQDTTLTLTIATSSLGTLVNNAVILIDSVSYKINKFIVLANGLETKLWLSMVN